MVKIFRKYNKIHFSLARNTEQTFMYTDNAIYILLCDVVKQQMKMKGHI